MLSPKIAHVSSYCVACGTCMKECPREAITIEDGIKGSSGIPVGKKCRFPL